MSSFSVRFTTLPFSKEECAGASIYNDTARDGLEIPDDALIARICAGDPEALGLLFHRYARLVWTIAHRILQNREEAEDLLQDVFLLVRRRASAFDRSKGSVRSLLVQMCYQRAYSRRRDLSRREFYGSADACELRSHFTTVPPYDVSLEAHFGKTGLEEALQTLSSEQRETLRLCFVEGYTIEEISERMSTSLGNVRHHYYRGLAKLRKYLVGK